MATWTSAAPTEIEPTGWAPRHNPGAWAVMARAAHCHACGRLVPKGAVAALYPVGDGETALACRVCAEVQGEGGEMVA